MFNLGNNVKDPVDHILIITCILNLFFCLINKINIIGRRVFYMNMIGGGLDGVHEKTHL